MTRIVIRPLKGIKAPLALPDRPPARLAAYTFWSLLPFLLMLLLGFVALAVVVAFVLSVAVAFIVTYKIISF